MKIILFLTLINQVLCQGYFKLVLNEEFENKTLDQNIWIDRENDPVNCEGNGMKQLNCNTNSSDNLILTDGVLAIKAIKHSYDSTHGYTSAKIMTRHNYTYGRFEIRAALPVGKMLRPAMLLYPTTPLPENKTWPENGQVDIMTNAQTNEIGNGAHFNRDNEYAIYYTNWRAKANLNNFNTYAVEWTSSEIRWFFNEINYFNFSLSETKRPNGSPFDKPFQLIIHLGVGGNTGFDNQKLSWYDYYFWECSALILDYVRIYAWIDEETGPLHLTRLNDTLKSDSAPGICKNIMPFRLSSISIFILILLILVSIIFIPIIVILIVRKVRLNRLKMYDDAIELDQKPEYNDYDIPYYINIDETDLNECAGSVGANIPASNSYLSILNSKQNSSANLSEFSESEETGNDKNT